MKKLFFCWVLTALTIVYVFLAPFFFTPYSVPVKFPNNYELFSGNSVAPGYRGLVVTESIDNIINRSDATKNKIIMEVTPHWGLRYWLSDNGIYYHARQQIPQHWWNFLQINTRYDRGVIIISGGSWPHYAVGLLVAAIFFLLGILFIQIGQQKKREKSAIINEKEREGKNG